MDMGLSFDRRSIWKVVIYSSRSSARSSSASSANAPDTTVSSPVMTWAVSSA